MVQQALKELKSKQDDRERIREDYTMGHALELLALGLEVIREGLLARPPKSNPFAIDHNWRQPINNMPKVA